MITILYLQSSLIGCLPFFSEGQYRVTKDSSQNWLAEWDKDSGISQEHVQQHLRYQTLETTQFYARKMTQKTYLQQMLE